MKHRNMLSPLMIMLLIAAVSMSCADMSFSDFDANRDDAIQKNEFRSEFVRNYSDNWDSDNDAGFDDENFYTTTYDILDRDDDNMLIRDEWGIGYDYYYGDYLVDDYNVYDLNRDNYVSLDEYLGAMRDTEYFITIDTDRDSWLSETELADAIFESWDTNDNGSLDQSEYAMLDAHYRDF